MKKARSAFILCLAFILICTTHLTLVPVSSASIKDTKFHVQFNSNGGSYCPPVYDILYGTTIDLPINPTRYNYWFRGWYCDSSFTIKFDSNTKIYSNLVLYAKWEQKGTPPYILSQRIGTGNIDSTVTIDISKQTYGSACKMNLYTYEHEVLHTLVNSVSKTEKYLGFELNVDDLNFSESNPLPVRVRIPSGFNSTNTAIFYSTNRITVSGKPECYVNNNGELVFDAYYSGTYVIVECIDQKNDITDPDAYVEILGPSKVKVNQQACYTYQFREFSGDESQYDFTWYSSYPHIATVDKEGVVTAHMPGKTTISCVSGNSKFVAKKVITVPGTPVKSIKTNVNSVRIPVKRHFNIQCTVKPNNATNKKLTFHSTNVHVATVTSKGRVVGHRRGSCYIVIKATDGSKKTKKVKVTVY